jgi:hypothetical protein
MRQAPGFGWSLLSAVLGIAVGVLLLWWPLTGALSLTVMLTVFFVIEGVASIFYALEHKRELSARWGWVVIRCKWANPGTIRGGPSAYRATACGSSKCSVRSVTRCCATLSKQSVQRGQQVYVDISHTSKAAYPGVTLVARIKCGQSAFRNDSGPISLVNRLGRIYPVQDGSRHSVLH